MSIQKLTFLNFYLNLKYNYYFILISIHIWNKFLKIREGNIYKGNKGHAKVPKTCFLMPVEKINSDSWRRQDNINLTKSIWKVICNTIHPLWLDKEKINYLNFMSIQKTKKI